MLVYGQAALAAIATLNVVRMLVNKGLVVLEPGAEAAPVVVTYPITFPVEAARLNPASELTGYGAAAPRTSTSGE